MAGFVCEILDKDLVAGQPNAVERQASYFILVEGTDVDATFYAKGSKIGEFQGMQGGDAVGPLSRDYDKVELRTATSQTVKYGTTSDPVTITRLSGNVNSKPAPLNSYQALASLNFAAAGTDQIAAKQGRALLELVADPANTGTIWIGSTDGTGGIPLTAGGVWSNYVDGAVDVYADSAGDTLHAAEGLS